MAVVWGRYLPKNPFAGYPVCAQCKVPDRLFTELPLRHLLHRLREPEDFGVAVSGAQLKADFLSPQALPAVVEQFQTPAWALDFYEAHVKARLLGTLPQGWASIALIRSPADSSWYGVPSTRGTLVCTPPGEPIDGRITPGFRCLSVGVPPAVWARCQALAGVERGGFRGGTTHRLAGAACEQIEHQLLALRGLLRHTGSTASIARQTRLEAIGIVTHLFTLAWELHGKGTPGLPAPSLRNRARLARRAEDWMRQHLGEAVQVPDVCEAMGVSRRELEYAFRTTFDQSPRGYLQALRLNAIHRELQCARQGQDTVIRVALDHGITHLSRFAAHYRSLFGESPGATLRQ